MPGPAVLMWAIRRELYRETPALETTGLMSVAWLHGHFFPEPAAWTALSSQQKLGESCTTSSLFLSGPVPQCVRLSFPEDKSLGPSSLSTLPLVFCTLISLT